MNNSMPLSIRDGEKKSNLRQSCSDLVLKATSMTWHRGLSAVKSSNSLVGSLVRVGLLTCFPNVSCYTCTSMTTTCMYIQDMYRELRPSFMHNKNYAKKKKNRMTLKTFASTLHDIVSTQSSLQASRLYNLGPIY